MSPEMADQKVVRTMTWYQWLGLIITYLLIPVTLFACGGSLAWWQAWVFSLLVVGAGLGGRMLAERKHPGLLAERLRC